MIEKLILGLKGSKSPEDSKDGESERKILLRQLQSISTLRKSGKQGADLLRKIGREYEILVQIPDSGDATGLPPNSIWEKHFFPNAQGPLGKALGYYIPVKVNGSLATQQQINEAWEKVRSNHVLNIVKSAIIATNGKS